MPVDLADLINKSNGVPPESVTEQVVIPNQEAVSETVETQVETAPESVTEEVSSFMLSDLGDFKSIDDVKTVIEKAKTFNSEEYEKIKVAAQKSQEYETVIEQLKNTSPYKNTDFARLEKIQEERPDDYNIFKKIVFGDPSKDELRINPKQSRENLKDFIQDYLSSRKRKPTTKPIRMNTKKPNRITRTHSMTLNWIRKR
jgi:hypothetical protein